MTHAESANHSTVYTNTSNSIEQNLFPRERERERQSERSEKANGLPIKLLHPIIPFHFSFP
ncbi:hypothetical protein Pfo_006337, partial [Paulownia fortunei]